MASFLSDTNLLLRVADAASNQHMVAIEALGFLLGRGDEVYITG